MSRSHAFFTAAKERLANVFEQLSPPSEEVIRIDAIEITVEQFHAIRAQTVANVAFRTGVGDLQQKNRADGAVVELFGGLEDPNMGMINFSGHLAEHVALDVTDLLKSRNA